MNKQQILDAFVELWSDLPAQRTKLWFDARTFSIGASELGTLRGLNIYQVVRELIESHCGLRDIGDKTAMNWGNVLEPVITAFSDVDSVFIGRAMYFVASCLFSFWAFWIIMLMGLKKKDT